MLMNKTNQTVIVFVLGNITILISYIAILVDSHGYLIEPAARNSLWRLEDSAPINYDDNQLFCGGIGALRQNDGKCGVCGDPYNGPRIHETGGYMAINKTVKNYFPGSTIDMVVDLDTNHGGTFKFQICWRDSFKIKETEECFEDLKLANGDEIYHLSRDAKGVMIIPLILPPDRSCRACIIRWDYRAANNWGKCPNGQHKVGCGLQELYRNCADVSVRNDGFGIGLGSGLISDDFGVDYDDDVIVDSDGRYDLGRKIESNRV